jgi:hypothetical protein
MTLEDLQRLSGVVGQGRSDSCRTVTEGSNISVTAAEKVAYMKQHQIEPGTQAWFRLWFSLPFLTGEKPTGPTDHR